MVIVLTKLEKRLGVVELANEDKVKRVSLTLFLDNPEHKKVFDVLSRVENKNQFMRNAIISYGDIGELKRQVPTSDEVRNIVEDTLNNRLEEYREMFRRDMQQMLDELAKQQSSGGAKKATGIDFAKLKEKY